MRIFVAGATGALGIHLVPRLVAAGHEVTGMTRTPSKQDALRAQGARPVVADALDPDAVARAVAEAEPEVKTEADPLDPDPPEALRATIGAIRHLERAVTGIADGQVQAVRSLVNPDKLGHLGPSSELATGRWRV